MPSVRYVLQHGVHGPAYGTRKDQAVDLFLTHLFAIVAGVWRIENTQTLVHNGVIPPLVGLPECPHRELLRTCVWRFGPTELANLEAAHARADRFSSSLVETYPEKRRVSRFSGYRNTQRSSSRTVRW
ncbi:MAG: hypothetical protein HYZ89_00415 [Candidatus Omnitrophica bacterium]|nr:hypothetical protein [Candidatus Omnitrophota bacterium]